MKLVDHVQRYLFYRRSQYWDSGRIGAYQDRMLVRLVQHAARNVPYYRNLFREVGFDPSAFGGRADMDKIPPLDKDTLRTRREEFIAEDAETFGINYDSTSGSTGTPLQLVIDDSTKINKLTALIRCCSWAGYTLGKSTFSLQSYLKLNLPPDAGITHKRLFNVYRFDSNHLNKEAGLKCLKELSAIRPKIYMGYPLPYLMLSKYAEEEGIYIPSPQSMIVFGEQLSSTRRSLLEKAFRTEVFDFYSLHECAGMIANCEYGNLHWMEDFAYNEILDGDEKILPEGEGELVGTSLYNYAMPLIRYKIRDTVDVASAVERCDCGRHFRVVRKIIGRQNDYIETPDGRAIGNVMEHAIDKAKGVTLSQCVQDSRDHIYLNLVVDAEFNESTYAELEDSLRKRLGSEIEIDFKIVSELEKNKGGKTPFILSKIGHEYV
jgi:phenylacetate-CoA ligase